MLFRQSLELLELNQGQAPWKTGRLHCKYVARKAQAYKLCSYSVAQLFAYKNTYLLFLDCLFSEKV